MVNCEMAKISDADAADPCRTTSACGGHVLPHESCKRTEAARRRRRQASDFKSKAEIVAFVKKCVEDGAAVIKAKGDKGLNESVNDGGPHLNRLYDLAYGLIEHSGEHYGQMVVHYRANGMVPPESRPKK